jgi:4-hydroxy-3-methylbut-2-en-1-yl diphosphate reductase
MKTFDVPLIYRSPLITAIKNHNKQNDKLKKDFAPTLLDFGTVHIYLARHFGFCYGVENAIEIAFRTVTENPGKRIFLLSEMIHNPQVNADLQVHGVQFLQDTYGKELIPLDSLTKEDIVLIPAFGTTLAMEEKLKAIGIPIEKYDTTCPFVEKVWNRSEAIAAKGFTVVVHGKPTHEETRATFSHSAAHTPTVVVKDMDEAKLLAQYITGEEPLEHFYESFKNQYSEGFDATKDLQKIGVVNQTTMLAEDTQAIADYLKQIISTKNGIAQVKEYFADTRDTLCYATNDNQTAVKGMLQVKADLAIVVGGYNSSNTSHLVELCELELPTYYINGADKILSAKEIQHYNFHEHTEQTTQSYLQQNNPTKILITSGASCPDAMVEQVIRKILSYFETSVTIEDWLTHYN